MHKESRQLGRAQHQRLKQCKVLVLKVRVVVVVVVLTLMLMPVPQESIKVASNSSSEVGGTPASRGDEEIKCNTSKLTFTGYLFCNTFEYTKINKYIYVHTSISTHKLENPATKDVMKTDTKKVTKITPICVISIKLLNNYFVFNRWFDKRPNALLFI